MIFVSMLSIIAFGIEWKLCGFKLATILLTDERGLTRGPMAGSSAA